jgi:type I restriction enzyme M protein
MVEAAFLHCPIRGQLSVHQRAQDGLKFTEEKCRIDALRYLLQRGYPADHFQIETTLLRFGHRGRNSFRVDFSVYSEPFDDIRRLPFEERVDFIKLVSEIKRSNDDATLAKATQVRPALNLLPDLTALGVYWALYQQSCH